MSEHMQSSTYTQEVEANDLLARLMGLIDTFDYQSGSFLLAENGEPREGERLEPMRVEVPGGTTEVIRHRFSEKINQFRERRERYYMIREFGRHPLLLYMNAELAEEDDLITAGDFEAIAPLHKKLARRTATGLAAPEVKLGNIHDIHHFSLLVHDALHRQKILRESPQA